MNFIRNIKILILTAVICAPLTSIADTLKDCGHISKLSIKRNELIVCSRGELFSAKGNTIKGDSLVIYQRIGNDVRQLRDLTGVSPTMEEVVTVKTDNIRRVTITVLSSEFPAWKSVPLFEEVFDFDTKTSTIRSLRKTQKFDMKAAESRFLEINKSHDEILKKSKKMGRDYSSFLYGNLSRLRDYAFSNPSLIETFFKKLQHLDWVDGEVAEVFSTLYAQVSYVAESKRRSHFK